MFTLKSQIAIGTKYFKKLIVHQDTSRREYKREREDKYDGVGNRRREQRRK